MISFNMTYTVSITSQGQLSIPISIRRELGFNTFKKGIVTVVDGKVIIEPIKDLLSLKGSLKSSSVKVTPAEMRREFENYLADEGMK